MEYRVLGKTGLEVSQLCFGTMSFGGDADEATSQDMFKRCRDIGINFFDTADVYNGGKSEEILGRLVAGIRDEVIISSKFGAPIGAGPNAGGMTRRHVMLQVERSLRRLRTDRLELYFAHLFDPRLPMEEILRALDDLVRQGKILYPAVSNWAAWQIAKALGLSALHGLAAFTCIQPQYSLIKRQVEVEILPLAQSEGLGVMTYSPTGAGLLTGKYGKDRRPDAGRAVQNKMYTLRYGDPVYYEIADKFTAHARERGVHPVSLAVAWVGSNPAVTCPIVGARNLEQLEPALAALDVPMTPEWRGEISALSIDPPPPTDRHEEKHGMKFFSKDFELPPHLR